MYNLIVGNLCLQVLSAITGIGVQNSFVSLYDCRGTTCVTKAYKYHMGSMENTEVASWLSSIPLNSTPMGKTLPLSTHTNTYAYQEGGHNMVCTADRWLQSKLAAAFETLSDDRGRELDEPTPKASDVVELVRALNERPRLLNYKEIRRIRQWSDMCLVKVTGNGNCYFKKWSCREAEAKVRIAGVKLNSVGASLRPQVLNIGTLTLALMADDFNVVTLAKLNRTYTGTTLHYVSDRLSLRLVIQAIATTRLAENANKFLVRREPSYIQLAGDTIIAGSNAEQLAATATRSLDSAKISLLVSIIVALAVEVLRAKSEKPDAGTKQDKSQHSLATKVSRIINTVMNECAAKMDQEYRSMFERDRESIRLAVAKAFAARDVCRTLPSKELNAACQIPATEDTTDDEGIMESEKIVSVSDDTILAVRATLVVDSSRNSEPNRTVARTNESKASKEKKQRKVKQERPTADEEPKGDEEQVAAANQLQAAVAREEERVTGVSHASENANDTECTAPVMESGMLTQAPAADVHEDKPTSTTTQVRPSKVKITPAPSSGVPAVKATASVSGKVKEVSTAKAEVTDKWNRNVKLEEDKLRPVPRTVGQVVTPQVATSNVKEKPTTTKQAIPARKVQIVSNEFKSPVAPLLIKTGNQSDRTSYLCGVCDRLERTATDFSKTSACWVDEQIMPDVEYAAATGMTYRQQKNLKTETQSAGKVKASGTSVEDMLFVKFKSREANTVRALMAMKPYDPSLEAMIYSDRYKNEAMRILSDKNGKARVISDLEDKINIMLAETSVDTLLQFLAWKTLSRWLARVHTSSKAKLLVSTMSGEIWELKYQNEHEAANGLSKLLSMSRHVVTRGMIERITNYLYSVCDTRTTGGIVASSEVVNTAHMLNDYLRYPNPPRQVTTMIRRVVAEKLRDELVVCDRKGVPVSTSLSTKYGGAINLLRHGMRLDVMSQVLVTKTGGPNRGSRTKFVCLTKGVNITTGTVVNTSDAVALEFTSTLYRPDDHKKKPKIMQRPSHFSTRYEEEQMGDNVLLEGLSGQYEEYDQSYFEEYDVYDNYD